MARVDSKTVPASWARPVAEVGVLHDGTREPHCSGRQDPGSSELHTAAEVSTDQKRQQIYVQARQWVAQDVAPHLVAKDLIVPWEHFGQSLGREPGGATRLGPIPGGHVVSPEQQELLLSIGQIDIPVESLPQTPRSKERASASPVSGRVVEAASSRLRRHYLRIP